MKKIKWKDIFERLENGEITEEKAQEEIVKHYCVPPNDKMNQCN